MATANSPLPPTLKITVEFSGGLELLFDSVRTHNLAIPATIPLKESSSTVSGPPSNIDFLVRYLCENLMKDPRKEMFLLGGNVRPGILVLINDADWELEGEEEYELQEGDHVLFVSTLHGG